MEHSFVIYLTDNIFTYLLVLTLILEKISYIKHVALF